MSTYLEGAAALDAIAAVRDACLAHDGVDPLDEAAALRVARHGLEGIDSWVSREGFALRSDAEGGRLDLAVAPPARRAGLGARLAADALRAPGDLGAWSHGDHPAAAALAARHQMRRARDLWVMRRPTTLAVDEVPAPEGVTIRDYGDADAEQVLAVNAAAFAHHPEQGDLDAEGLADRMAEAWFDPAGLLLAVDADGRLLGFHWTKQHDRHTGEVYVVAISPDAQGRGLGRVLTAAGLHHLAARGVAEVLLYVEADNTAARSLYAGLGFTHAASDTHVQYRRDALTEPRHPASATARRG